MALRPSLSRSLFYVLAITSIVHAGDLTPPAEYEGKAVADVRAAIKRLYGTGEYSNIEVDTEPAADGVSLIFRTTSQWFVGSVDVKGKINQPPSASQLASATRLDLGAPFSDRDVDTAVDNLRTLLQRNGLYRGAVTPEVVRDSQHEQVAITFRVDSGKRARLMLPNVVGDTKIPAANVARAAKYKEILFFPWKLATQTDLQNGLQSVRYKYEKQDRLTASVTLDRSDYLAAANRVQPTIRADGGPKVKIDADGAKVSKKILKRYVPVFDEGTVNQDLLVTGARNLRDYFQNRGYFDVQVGLASHNASPVLEVITYKVSLGAAHRVVSLTVKGNRYFTTAEIRERMFLQPKGFIRLRRGRYSQGFATRDGEAIQALYRDSGFRDCQV